MSTLPQIPADVQLTPPELDVILGFPADDEDETLPPDWPDAPGRAPEPALPFADWLAAQASYYRFLGTPAADWLAARLTADAATARLVRARTPDDFDDRETQLIEGHQMRLRADGYDSAMNDYGLPRW